ncbi:zinc ABC transporter substrate-binding protein [Pontibaca sp. S1109L]|uniref:Zinc ABC transporter substrate-binding protein n=2 Tax=Pontibaca salina TaxID=2795731 RepID=A0A934M2P7_9RHOB|nr:zinc ABC transporter substrate-binding protein [Pontibaca salina]
MSRNPLSLTFTAILMGGAAFANVSKIAADIAPVHSLVARLMGGLGTPNLIMRQGTTPHQYSLRPSETQSLQVADLFWKGIDRNQNTG